jgi:hypothetical protein
MIQRELGGHQVGDLHRSVLPEGVKNTFPDFEVGNERAVRLAASGGAHLPASRNELSHSEMRKTSHCASSSPRSTTGIEIINCGMRSPFLLSNVLNLGNAEWGWELLGPILKEIYLQLADAGIAKPLPYLRWPPLVECK